MSNSESDHVHQGKGVLVIPPYDVYISYERDALDAAVTLKKEFESRGWHVFLFVEGAAGPQSAAVLERVLSASKTVVVLWSKASVKSKWVCEEARVAAVRNVLFAVAVDHVQEPPSIASIESSKLLNWNGDLNRLDLIGIVALRDLLRSISNHLDSLSTAFQPYLEDESELGLWQPVKSHPLVHGASPEWADGWGQDDFGPFVEISVQSSLYTPVAQRLRWCPAGAFLMGSPDTEQNRDDDESPQHQVRLSQGFWIFDTPVAQAFWQAVMGDNPSHFVSPDRPVERVSFERVQDFLLALNTQKPGLDLALPTEAQWEYACRAGSVDATYAGDMPIAGGNNAPVLQDIAWYGGNSSQGFELVNGSDSSGWEDVAHPGERSGSHPVAQKHANAWGLYDTLGNVWEWCDDGLRIYGEHAVTDPIGPNTGDRAVRGGAWLNRASDARAASRFGLAPGSVGSDLGFRCLQVQVV